MITFLAALLERWKGRLLGAGAFVAIAAAALWAAMKRGEAKGVEKTETAQLKSREEAREAIRAIETEATKKDATRAASLEAEKARLQARIDAALTEPASEDDSTETLERAKKKWHDANK